MSSETNNIGEVVQEKLQTIGSEIKEMRKEVDEVRNEQSNLRRDFEHAIADVKANVTEGLHKQTVETLQYRALQQTQFTEIQKSLMIIQTENSSKKIEKVETDQKICNDKVDERLKALENWRWYIAGIGLILGLILTYVLKHLP